MDLKEPESAGICLEFNTGDQHQFVDFSADENDDLAIQQVAQLPISSGGLIIPAPTVTRDDVTEQDRAKTATTYATRLAKTAMTTAKTLKKTAPTVTNTMAAQRSTNQKIFRDLKKKKLETNINQSWFTGKHAKESLQEQGHSWKQGMWSKEEIDILIANIEDYVKARQLKDPMQVIFQLKKEDRKDFYRTIASGLNRPLFAVYRRVQRMYDSKNYVGKYSAADIERLKSLRASLGNDWAKIGAEMGRSASSVKDKCRLLKETCQQGKWKFDEEERLTAAVYEVTKTSPGESITGGIPWQQVAEKVVTRTEKQCRAKWLNYLNWKHTGGTEWDKNDDDKLLEKMRAFMGKDEQLIPWQQLAKGWKSVRSPQWLRSKWWSLKRTVPNYETYSIPDLVNLLKKSQRKQRLRFDVFPSGLSHSPFKIARLEVPHLSSIKNRTVMLHLPLPIHSGGATISTADVPVTCTTAQLGALAETYRRSKAAGTSSRPLLVQALEPSGAVLDDHFIVQSIESPGAAAGSHQIVVQSLQQPSGSITDNHRIVVRSMEPLGGLRDQRQVVVQSVEPPGSIPVDHRLLVQSMVPPEDHQLVVQSLDPNQRITDNHQIVVGSIKEQLQSITQNHQIVVQSIDPNEIITENHQIVVQSMDPNEGISDDHQIVVQSMEEPLQNITDNHQIVVQSVVPSCSFSEDGQMVGHSIIEQHGQQVVIESVDPPTTTTTDNHQMMARTISDSHGMVSSSLQDEVIARSQSCPESVELHETASSQYATSQEADQSHGIRSHDDEDSLGVRVSLHDASHHQLTQSEVDHLTNDIHQSDHTDGIEDSHLSSQLQLIGTDAVLSSQQEVTSSELQVVPDSSIQEDDKHLASVRSAPPSEGLLVQPGSQDNTHLENSVFTLSGSLLSCQSDHAYLMEPPSELETKTKLPVSSHS